jgi:hypothetical protein
MLLLGQLLCWQVTTATGISHLLPPAGVPLLHGAPVTTLHLTQQPPARSAGQYEVAPPSPQTTFCPDGWHAAASATAQPESFW